MSLVSDLSQVKNQMQVSVQLFVNLKKGSMTNIYI